MEGLAWSMLTGNRLIVPCPPVPRAWSPVLRFTRCKPVLPVLPVRAAPPGIMPGPDFPENALSAAK